MTSFVFDIGEKSRRVSRQLGQLRSDLQDAFLAEKKSRRLTQQAIAESLNVNRSVINRQLKGTENITARSAIELAWAMGWDTRFEVFKPQAIAGQNEPMDASQMEHAEPIAPIGTGTRTHMPVSIPSRNIDAAQVITSSSRSILAE
jgi:transcriptional regulator with XRE-family HTH domain